MVIKHRQDAVHRRVAQLAHRAGPHQLAHVPQRLDVSLFAAAVRDAGQNVRRHLRAHAAGHALAARLALGHRHVRAGHVHQVNTFTAALAARLGKEQEAIPPHQGPDGVARLILAELLDLGQQGRTAV